MKTLFKILILPFCFSCLFLSCDDDYVRPKKDVRNAFKDMYPSAKFVEWEMEYGYYVVDFRDRGYEKEAWFDTSGTWLLTETDLGRNLPSAISVALSQTEYSGWRVDDVDYIEQKDKEPFYIVEIEKGELERDLYFSESGQLLDVQRGNGDYRPMSTGFKSTQI